MVTAARDRGPDVVVVGAGLFGLAVAETVAREYGAMC
jgi:NADPH-dependent 2,4-dienoyl-CoA reductase/sulfur reductase-like enzyme